MRDLENPQMCAICGGAMTMKLHDKGDWWRCTIGKKADLIILTNVIQ